MLGFSKDVLAEISMTLVLTYFYIFIRAVPVSDFVRNLDFYLISKNKVISNMLGFNKHVIAEISMILIFTYFDISDKSGPMRD